VSLKALTRWMGAFDVKRPMCSAAKAVCGAWVLALAHRFANDRQQAAPVQGARRNRNDMC
jgi:hypothetical protein